MSTIEKAIEKMERPGNATPAAGATPSQAETLSENRAELHSTIQQAIERFEDHSSPSPIHVASKAEPTPLHDKHSTSSPSSNVEQPRTTAPGQETALAVSGREIKLDMLRLRAAGMVTPDAARSQIAEEFRMIKRPLLKNAFGQGAALVENGNLIMVTSAFPGEGKTFNSINLAMSIATEFDNTVLLIDADVARPAVTAYFGIETGPGLVDYLTGDYPDLSQLLIRTDIPKLTLLPAGRRHHHSTELLASENMRNLVRELSQRYSDRIVIFDSPPLLATTEASVLASLMGQIVVVVESEKTTQDALKEALSLLDASKSINLVLNKSRQPFGADYYGAYYGTYGQ
ncbi:MAG: XrtA-associated tyrosine autokinase [Gammaproteobacteria bacterium]